MTLQRHLLARVLLLVLLLSCLLGLSAAQATGAKPRERGSCRWGASSIRAELVDGRIVESPAASSGCVAP